ncbi:MAG: glycerol-3-phosphate acyltransferase [Thermodesulfobacteriota bacterium]
MRNVILLSLATYLAASINFSIILFELLGKGDPRDHYSRNAGTTNVTRLLGLFWGLMILLLDMGRAGAAAYIGGRFLPAPLVPLLGLVLVIGNQKPLFHGFRGGKGVASYLGFTAMIAPVLAGASCLAWLFGYGLSRQPFIGSILMILVLGLGTIVHYSGAWPVMISAVLTMVLILQSHKPNMAAYGKKMAKKEIPSGA